MCQILVVYSGLTLEITSGKNERVVLFNARNYLTPIMFFFDSRIENKETIICS